MGAFPKGGTAWGWSGEKSRGVEEPEKITAAGAAESQGIPPADETKPAAPKTAPAEPSSTLPGKQQITGKGRRPPPHDPWTPRWGREENAPNDRPVRGRTFRIAEIQTKNRFPRLGAGGVLTASSPIHTFASSIPQRRPRPQKAAEGCRSLHLQPRIIRRGGIVSTGFPGLNAPWRGLVGTLEGVVEIESGES